MKTNLALLATALAVLANTAAAQQACQQTLVVGSWNIEWLGNAIKRKRPAQTPADIAKYIAASKVDVLALAEVSVPKDSPAGARNQTLDQAFAILNATGAAWEYTLFPKRAGSRDHDDQWTGLAWNATKVSNSGGPWELDVKIDAAKEKAIAAPFKPKAAGTTIWSRLPYITRLSAGAGKSDFLFMPVHLKSNIGGGATSRARAYEINLAMDALAALPDERKDKDLIILGDMNMLSNDEPAALALKAGGLKDCNALDAGTHLNGKTGKGEAPFDRIFVSASEPETRDACASAPGPANLAGFTVIQPAQWEPGLASTTFRERMSDHLLVTATICVTDDDD